MDFAKLSNPDNVLKQAYVTVRPVPKRVQIAAGILKLPFSTIELDPIARFELSDLGTPDDVIENLGFGGRDVGVELMVAPLPKPKLLRFSLGAFRGHAQDEHASPLGAIGVRIESKPLKSLRIGVDAVGMPTTDDYERPFDTGSKDVLPNPPDPLFPREQRWAAGKGYSADITFEAHHLMLRGEGWATASTSSGATARVRFGQRGCWRRTKCTLVFCASRRSCAPNGSTWIAITRSAAGASSAPASAFRKSACACCLTSSGPMFKRAHPSSIPRSRCQHFRTSIWTARA